MTNRMNDISVRKHGSFIRFILRKSNPEHVESNVAAPDSILTALILLLRRMSRMIAQPIDLPDSSHDDQSDSEEPLAVI